MQAANDTLIEQFLEQHENWVFADDAISADFSFTDFKSAMSFVVRLSYEAEAAGHHPDIFISYNRVTLRLSTHDAGNVVTEADLSLAKRIESILN